jgi:hypothetical protein
MSIVIFTADVLRGAGLPHPPELPTIPGGICGFFPMQMSVILHPETGPFSVHLPDSNFDSPTQIFEKRL